ncbi:MAG: thioredoxin domain-containing protein [Sulfurimonas sp.]
MKSINKLFFILFLFSNIHAKEFTNSLIHQDSPYLQQHAHNPVHWMAFGDEAFAKAKKENKLIFLSIGYSTCHWCHVMERETFTNLSSAKILNDNYISIKVDKEEMPDVDKYYQNIYAILNQRAGGWPLSIVMTPEKKVIYSATYLPSSSVGDRRSFNEMMSMVHGKFKHDTKVLNLYADKVMAYIKQVNQVDVKKGSVDLRVVENFVKELAVKYDTKYKGFGTQMKFPHANTFDTLLDIYKVNHNKKALQMSKEALEAMANGGIYDQIEGGFFRYSTDRKWMIPHFEKMLYTNAELIALYAKMDSISPSKVFKKVVNETINNMNERFFYKGLYKSASDADSEEEEGKYFVFSYNKTKAYLRAQGFKNTQEILEYFNITPSGNFENARTNPYITDKKVPKNIKLVTKALKELRAEVRYPFIDSKMSTSWNALMATALFEAGNIDKKYTKNALDLVDNILRKLRKNEVLYHQVLPNSTLKVKAYLEDYSFLIDALIKAYQESKNDKYLKRATNLLHIALGKFYKNEIWYLSDGKFVARASLQGGSYKSSMAKMIENIFVLSLLNSDEKLYKIANENIKNVSEYVKSYPSSYPELIKIIIYFVKK